MVGSPLANSRSPRPAKESPDVSRVPGKVVDIADEASVLMGRVDFGGVARKP